MSQVNIDTAYYEFLNSDETRAPESVTTGYSEFRGALDRYLEALTEFEWKAEEFCLSSGSGCVIRVNKLLKEIARIRREKGQITVKTDEIRIFHALRHIPRNRRRWRARTCIIRRTALLNRRSSLTEPGT